MLRAAWYGLRKLASPRRSHRELEDELSSYLEAAVAEKMATGLSEPEARRQVRLENGSPDSIAEHVHAARWETTITDIVRDLRYGLRVLRKNPGMAAVAILTLTLGIGSITAVFSVVRGILLRPFPFRQQDRLLMLWQKGLDGKRSNVGFATVEDWQRMNHSFESISAISYWDPTLVTSAESENLNGFRVSAGTFDLLGTRMALGRDFVHNEDTPGHNTVAILSDGLWQRRFNRDPHILGKTVQLGSKLYTVVGVLPPDFPPIFSSDPRKDAEIYSPLGYDTSLQYACRGCQHLRVLGRLRDGVTAEQALAEMNHISDVLIQRYPTEYSNPGVLFTSLRDYVVGDVRPALIVLLSAVGFVLLIACVNVSNLLLSSAARRRREFALRRSLGARPSRLIRQLLTESLLLALFGGVFGLMFSQLVIWLLPALGLSSLPRLHDIRLDPSVFFFTLLISLLSSMFFGVLPAIHSRRIDPAESLNEGVRSTASVSRQRLRNVLIAADVALSLVLLVGAGLMGKSFVRLIRTDPGFSDQQVLTLSVSLWGQKYSTDAAVVNFYRDALARIAALPGVASAALTSQLPLGGNLDRYSVHNVERPSANPEEDLNADRYSISPDYFRALKIPLPKGREFTDADRADTTRVIVVNETFARTLWPGEDPIGKRVTIGELKSPPRTVVGVAGDVLHAGLNAPPTMQFYLPNTQFTDSDVILVVRVKKGSPAAFTAAVRRAISSVDSQQPISDVATMPEVVAASAARERFSALLFAGFAFCGLLMAAIGVYGVISYAVVQRTQEIGVRVAMGARPRDVVSLILEQGMKPVILGVVVGLIVAVPATQLLASLLFQLQPRDLQIFSATVAIVIAVALLACYLPARRALRIDPMRALRTE